jgi:hypothetical protein
MLAMLAAAQGVLTLAILCWRAEELGKLGRYARRNWRTFGVSGLGAFALSLLFTRAILENRIVRDALTTHNLIAVWGAWILLIALLIAACQKTTNFWARARRTWAFQNPPLQYLHVGAICVLYGGAGALFSRLPRISTEAMMLIGASAVTVFFWVVGHVGCIPRSTDGERY